MWVLECQALRPLRMFWSHYPSPFSISLRRIKNRWWWWTMWASGHLCLASQGPQRLHHTPSSTHHQPVLTSKLQESSGHRASYCASSSSGRSRPGLELSLFISVSKSSSYKTKNGSRSRHLPRRVSRHNTYLFFYQVRPWVLYLQIRMLAQPGKNLIY